MDNILVNAHTVQKFVLKCHSAGLALGAGRGTGTGASSSKLLKMLSAFSWHFSGRAAAGGMEAEHVPAHVQLQSSAAPQC